MCVCVVVVCTYTYMFVCCMFMGVWWCVHAHQCVHLCQVIRIVDTNLQVYVHVSVATQVIAHEHLTIAHYFSCMFTVDKLMLQLHTSM